MNQDTQRKLRLMAAQVALEVNAIQDDRERDEARVFLRMTLNEEFDAAERNRVTAPAMILATLGYQPGMLSRRAMSDSLSGGFEEDIQALLSRDEGRKP